jgi:excisionase family DNA binding protein
MANPSNDEWLSLHAASDLVGVHPATLRAWADRGHIVSQRTAGGHRRFRKSDIEHWARSRREPTASIEMLIQNAMGRVRMTLEQADMPWLTRLDADTRRQHRDLGRRMLMEIASALDPGVDSDSITAAARALGVDYTRLSHAHNLTLAETVRTFMFFRDTIADSFIQLVSHLEAAAAPDWIAMNRRLNEFTNAVLLGLIESYQHLESNP